MKANMGKKQNYKNIAMNVFAFVVQFFISFYISPLIVSKVGASAYGFIGLANDFVSYAAIIATVFNSVASRFIANSFYKKDYETANYYFNSLIVANIAISAILGLAGVLLVPNLDKVLSIPVALAFDVKLTFALVFGSYIISLLTLVFTTSTFVTNRTDIQGIRNIIQYLIRFALVVVFLNFISVRIYWVALATLIATTVIAIMNMGLTKKLTPELRIDPSKAKRKCAIELAKSGSWMALTSISTVLLRGLDLTVANVFVGNYEMGLLSIARTIPNNVTSIIATIAPIFTPVFIAYYAKNDIDGLVRNVKKSINTMALILFVPISGFIVFAYDFYALWQKSLSHEELMVVTLLSTMTVIQAFFNSVTSTMAQISVVVNKLKLPVLVSLESGIVSIVAEIALIKFFGMGLYAIVLSTTVVMIIRYIIFNSFYAAWCLKQPLTCFLPSALKTWVIIPVLAIVMVLVRSLLPIDSWIDLCIDAVIAGGLGYGIMLSVYGRAELSVLLGNIKNCVLRER